VRATRPSDQHSAGSRRADRPPLAAREVLTDGWNYMKVVVGSNLRAEVRMKSSHSLWAKHREASEVIELHGLFRNYWSSTDHEFTILSQPLSPIGLHRSDCEEQRPLSLENIVGL